MLLLIWCHEEHFLLLVSLIIDLSSIAIAMTVATVKYLHRSFSFCSLHLLGMFHPPLKLNPSAIITATVIAKAIVITIVKVIAT